MKVNLKAIMVSTIIILTMTPMLTVKAEELALNITQADNTKTNTYNVNIAKINHSNNCNIIIVQKNKDYYSFITDDNNFKVGQILTIAMNSNEQVIQAVPYVSKRDKYKLGDNGTTFVNQLTTDAELQEYSNRWIKENYNMDLDIPISFNTVKQDKNEDYIILGQTFYKNNKPVKIVIDYSLSTTIDDKNVITERMLIHELTHYALAKQNVPYEDNTTNFIAEALKNGASIDDKDNTAGVLHSHVLVNQNTTD